MRVAIGAARWALVRQFMIENLTLGFLGGAVGCALAYCGCALIVRFHPRQLPQLATVDIDLSVLTFGFVISVLSSLVFGTLPGWLGLHVNPSDAFKEGGAQLRRRAKEDLADYLWPAKWPSLSCYWSVPDF